MWQEYLSHEHRIVLSAVPQSHYHIYVYERASGSCVLSITYEYWQEVYARATLNALVSMSKARIITVPQRQTNKKSA